MDGRCLFEDELDKLQCVYWNDDCCREPEINCGNSDALCNEMIWKQRIKIEQLEAKNERIGKELADDMVSKLSGDELDRYLLKSTSIINKLIQKNQRLKTENENLKVPKIIVGINKMKKRIEELKTENSVIMEQNEAMNKSCVRYEKAIEKAINELPISTWNRIKRILQEALDEK